MIEQITLKTNLMIKKTRIMHAEQQIIALNCEEPCIQCEDSGSTYGRGTFTTCEQIPRPSQRRFAKNWKPKVVKALHNKKENTPV